MIDVSKAKKRVKRVPTIDELLKYETFTIDTEKAYIALCELEIMPEIVYEFIDRDGEENVGFAYDKKYREAIKEGVKNIEDV